MFDRSLYTDVVFFFFLFSAFLKHRRARVLLPPTPTPLRWWSKNSPAVLFFITRAHGLWRENRGPVHRLQWSSPEPWILVDFLANLFRFKDGFSKLHLVSNNKAFQFFFLRFSLRSSLTLNWAISLLFTQLVIFSIFSPRTCRSIRPVYQIRPKIRPPSQTIRSDSHTRPPDQITPPDHRPPSLTTQLPIITAYPTSWNGTGQVHSLWVGSRGLYRALDEPCKAYFPHTFGLNFPESFFGLT